MVKDADNPRRTGDRQAKALYLCLQALAELDSDLLIGNFHDAKATNVNRNYKESVMLQQ